MRLTLHIPAELARLPLSVFECIEWADDTQPRTERPVRFLRQSIADGEYPIVVRAKFSR